MVYICETKVGRNLSDEEEISIEDFIDYQMDKGDNVYFEEGNGMRSIGDLIEF
jgi:hypothetical protein